MAKFIKHIYDILILQVSAHKQFHQPEHFYDFLCLHITVLSTSIDGFFSQQTCQSEQHLNFSEKGKVTFNKLLFNFNRLSFKFISMFQLKLIGTSKKRKEKKGKEIVMRFTSLFVWKEKRKYINYFSLSYFFIFLYHFPRKSDCKNLFSHRKCLITTWKSEQQKKSLKCLIWRFTFNSFLYNQPNLKTV